MAFYKLFKRRTNYLQMLEAVDRLFRKEKWDRRDRKVAEAYARVMGPLCAISTFLPGTYYNQ